MTKKTYNTETKELEIVDVTFENNRATLIFLDEDAEGNSIAREVSYNKDSYDNTAGKFVADPLKAEKIEAKVKELFGVAFDELEKVIGETKRVFFYDNFNALEEFDITEKFVDEQEGELYTVPIKEIKDDGVGIKVRYEIDGKTYESKMTYSKYIKSMKKWLPDPIKKAKQYERFEDKFGVPFAEADTLIGKNITIEVKKSFGHLYGDMKKFKDK